jgi:maleylacetoacetate isomerase/maleylpyruvate isomerase
MLTLYSYYRSSAAYRVRIALNLKGLDYEIVPVHLARDGGEHLKPAYRAINPSSTVPALRLETGEVLAQSMAIIEYLDEVHPAPPLLPADARGRARVRAIAQMIACDIHPLNNLGVLKVLKHDLGASDEQKDRWYRHWVETGLGKVERVLADAPRGRFCHGDAPTLADCLLVPQVFNARRFNADLSGLSEIPRIVAECEALEAFRRAAPGNQPDAE